VVLDKKSIETRAVRNDKMQRFRNGKKGQKPITNYFNITSFQSTSSDFSGSLEDFCEVEGCDFVYPNDFPVRSYQISSVNKCIKHNTLVCMPTGCGKTLVASALIRNFMNWYPQGQSKSKLILITIWSSIKIPNYRK
jgi:superfamily II DNA or RNA helicase